MSSSDEDLYLAEEDELLEEGEGEGDDIEDDSKTENVTWTAKDVVTRAEQWASTCNYEISQQFYERAIQMDDKLISALDGLAQVLQLRAEVGEIDELTARTRSLELLNKALSLDTNHASRCHRFMGLGQCLEGKEALQAYLSSADEALKSNIPTLASMAYCLAGELYLTDLCYDDDAEQRCEEYLRKAIEFNPQNIESWQLLASMKLSQNNPQEAEKALRESYNLWYPQYQKKKDEEEEKLMKEDDQINEEENEDKMEEDEDGAKNLPEFSVRLSGAKLWIELQKWEESLDLLESITDERDDLPEVWFLIALCITHGGFQFSDDDSAIETDPLQTAMDALERAKTLLTLNEDDNNNVDKANDPNRTDNSHEEDPIKPIEQINHLMKKVEIALDKRRNVFGILK